MCPNERISGNSEDDVPVAAVVGGGGGEGWWWRKVVDMEEGKKQVKLAVPMVVTNVSYYIIPLVSVMFAGHLGPLQLAGSTLAHSWSMVTGFAFLNGISGALETLCGQAFGAKSYKKLGIYLQSSCIISFIFTILISMLWWYTEPILIFLHQSPDISKEASIYIRFLIPGLLAFATLQNILSFLQTQSIVWPLVICSMITMLLHTPLVYVLVHLTNLGYRGSPLATSLSFWVSVFMLVVYMSYAKKVAHTWNGISIESFRYVVTTLKLALPSAAMVCLEYWAFEILVLLAGLMPNSKMTTSIIAMCVNTEAIAYNLTYGLSAAASTRVSNELGGMRPNQAKHSMVVALELSIILACVILLALGFGHDTWAGLFSNNGNIIKGFSSMTPLLCFSIFVDSIQSILAGVSRGCGWQHIAMYINLGTYYGIGMPLACLLAYRLKFYAKGLWIGLTCGLTAQSVALFLVMCILKFATNELAQNHV